MSCESLKTAMDNAKQNLEQANRDWWQATLALSGATVGVIAAAIAEGVSLGLLSLIFGAAIVAEVAAAMEMEDSNIAYESAEKDFESAKKAYCDCLTS